MKYFSIILAVFFFSLAIVPCSDAHTCEESDMGLAHDHSQDHEDDCTPLCACSCCSISYTVPDLIEYVEIQYKYTHNYNFHYNNLYSFSFQSAIWQPPAL